MARWLDKYQNGGKTDLWNTDRTAWVDSIHNARRKDLDFVQRMFESKGSIPDPYDDTKSSTHLMTSSDKLVYPEVVNINGKLVHKDRDEARRYALGTKQYIEFPTAEKADWYATGTVDKQGWPHGYKQGTGVLNGIDEKTGKPIHKDQFQNGGEMSYYQHGLDFKPKTISKNGSVVKDNLGYLNPENFGKVVEIDSPNITMRNVKEPLIGISDVGEKKMMMPEHDYIFKGKKVTEYPIGKYGINELHQLQDFTNKPSTKNWLNKYTNG